MKNLFTDCALTDGTFSIVGNSDIDNMIINWFNTDESSHNQAGSILSFIAARIKNNIEYYVLGETGNYYIRNFGKAMLGPLLREKLDTMMITRVQKFVDYVNRHKLYQSLFVIRRFNPLVKSIFSEYLRDCKNTAGVFLSIGNGMCVFEKSTCISPTPCNCQCWCVGCIESHQYLSRKMRFASITGSIMYDEIVTDNPNLTYQDFERMVCRRWL